VGSLKVTQGATDMIPTFYTDGTRRVHGEDKGGEGYVSGDVFGIG